MIPVASAGKGVALVILATLVFASTDVLSKHLYATYAVPLVMAVRYLVNTAALAALQGPRDGPALWAARQRWLLILRGACLAAASLTMGLALRLMPVAETVAIAYLAPIGVMICAWWLLGEKVSIAGWLGVAAGFAGVLMIVRPGSGLDPLGVAFAMVNAALGTSYHLLTRLLGKTETMVSMLFHTSAVGLVVFVALLPFSAPMVLPGWFDLGIMVAFGLLATVGHYFFTAAYRHAPAALLAPVNYLHLVWAGLLGWAAFGHWPDGWTLAGMALVTAAGVTVALRARFAREPTE